MGGFGHTGRGFEGGAFASGFSKPGLKADRRDAVPELKGLNRSRGSLKRRQAMQKGTSNGSSSTKGDGFHPAFSRRQRSRCPHLAVERAGLRTLNEGQNVFFLCVYEAGDQQGLRNFGGNIKVSSAAQRRFEGPARSQ